MCAKCQAMQNTYMGRYGAIIQAYQSGTYDPENYVSETSVCEEYKKKMRSQGAAERQ